MREHVIYILEFTRVSDTSEQYVSETQKLAEIQHLVVTQGLTTWRDCSKTHNGQWSTYPSWWDTSRCLQVYGMTFSWSLTSERRIGSKWSRISDSPYWMSWKTYFGHIGPIGWTFRMVCSKVLGHSVRVKTQEVQGHQLQGSPVY